jgi:hypothetical protein
MPGGGVQQRPDFRKDAQAGQVPIYDLVAASLASSPTTRRPAPGQDKRGDG